MNRVIVWRITQNCNMNCLFCSYSMEVKRTRGNASPDDIRALIKVLGAYKKQNNCNMLISWIGGEPFLYKDIIPLSRELNKVYGIEVSATTNGIPLDSAKIKSEVVKFFSEIVFSVDGFAKCNDRVRKYEGHYAKTLETISEISRERAETGSRLLIKVNTILMRDNIQQFEEFCHSLVLAGVNEVTFNQLGGYDRPEFYQDNRLLIEQVKDFSSKLPNLKEKFLKLGLIIHGSDDYLQRITASTLNKKISVDECSPGSWFWFINENGLISPCSYTTYEYMLPIQSIKSIEDVDSVQNYFEELRTTKRSVWCDDCHCTQMHNKFD